MSAVFVTGTDTGIGKTRLCSALLRSLNRRGVAAIGMKPVASGCEWIDGRWRNEDALALMAASGRDSDYGLVNPVALEQATAPEIAAALEGRVLSLDPLQAAFTALQREGDVLVVEGVGGWLSPLSDTLMQADLVRRLNLPVVLVVGVRLGCINQALSSERALAGDGVRCLGWIGNSLDPLMPWAAETFSILRKRLALPCLGLLPHDATTAEALELDALLRGMQGEVPPGEPVSAAGAG